MTSKPPLCRVSRIKLSHSSSEASDKNSNKSSPDIFPELAKIAYDPPPSEILPLLFIGSSKNAHDKKLLNKLNISAVLCVKESNYSLDDTTDSHDFSFLPMQDNGMTDLKTIIDKAVNFIQKALLDKKGILVHCRGGVNRSVTIVLAYLMIHQGMSLREAYDHILARRPQIMPRRSYIEQLQEVEKSIFGKVTKVPLSDESSLLDKINAYRVQKAKNLSLQPSEISSQKIT